MRHSISNSRAALIGLVILTLLANGCVELKAVRKFAETAAVVGQKFPALSADVYGSCTRRYRYRFYRVVQFNPAQMTEIDNLSQTENLDSLQTNLPAEAVQEEGRCRRFKEVAPAAITLNQALVAYMKTMGDLAADDLTSYDKSLDALGKSIIGSNVFNEAEVNAGTSLAKFISTAVAGAYRHKKLKTAIETRNEDVKVLTNALKRYVGQNYVLALKDEQRQLSNYYKANIQEHQDRVGNADSLVVTSAKMTWDTEQRSLQDRIDAAEAYVKILNNVAEGHQKLYDSRNNLNSKEARQTALQYARAIENLIEEFRKAF